MSDPLLEDDPVTAALVQWQGQYLPSGGPGDREFSEIVGWVRRKLSEDGAGILRCGVDLGHWTAWVLTSSEVHPVGEGRNFGPYLKHHILWCVDCKKAVAVYYEAGDPAHRSTSTRYKELHGDA